MSAWGFLRRFVAGRGGVNRTLQQLFALCDALLDESGEYASTALAREALEAYKGLDEPGREQFFDVLARDYSPSPEAVAQHASAYQADPSPDQLARLLEAVEPPRQELFRRLNMAPGGTAALVEMRKELLKSLKLKPQWRVIDADLMHLLRSWFNRGFLRLERIDWRTPAIVLEKLIEYEAVHAIQGWRDLRRRLEADRRCFAFFHAQLPDEPLIFIEVALTRSLSAHIQPLLDIGSPVSSANCDCAMFYSITNCQEGLRGISFGNLLIKQVAEELQARVPAPAPLRHALAALGVPPLARAEARRASEGTGRARQAGPARLAPGRSVGCAAAHAAAPVRLLPAARKAGGEIEPLDPVARFHLGNGAALERLNWMGDISETGMARSAGLMVNYVYWLNEVERNHERYFREHAIAASPAVEKMARECVLAAPAEKGAAA